MLAVQGGELGALTEILGVAAEIDGMLRSLGAELKHARSTAAGLSNEVGSLRSQLRSAEDELGALRRENADLRGRQGALGVFNRSL